MEEKKECEGKKKCDDKQEKGCKQKEIDSLKAELEVALKTIEEQKSTINNYLATASYYKNELDSQKKDFDRYKERNKNFEAEASQKANETFATLMGDNPELRRVFIEENAKLVTDLDI